MSKKQDAERQYRINYEIIVDCYGEAEENMGWYYYFEDNLEFPIEAIIKLHKQDGKAEGVPIRIISIASKEEAEPRLGYVLPGSDYIHTIGIEDIVKVITNETNLQALNDWRYWKGMELW